MIGLFGGSFDPVHHGHLLVAQAAAEALGLAELRFVPAGAQPFKPAGHGAPAADRVAMLEAAVAGVPGFRVERDEAERPGPSYTVETLERLRAREPGARFAWLVGADAAADLPRWHRAAELPGLATLVVLTRPGAALPELPFPVRRVVVPALAISATVVRERVRTGRPVRFWVPEAVAEYIGRHRLYLAP